MTNSGQPRLFLPRGTSATQDTDLTITPATADWSFAGLTVITLAPGESRVIATGPRELVVLPLSGSATVTLEEHRFVLRGRESVFAAVSDFAYVPIETTFTIMSAGGGEFALPSALAEQRLEPAYGPAGAVAVEMRGAGQASRQINNFLSPEAFPADRLCAVEVRTPDGNWSSYPPPKHDQASAHEAVLEEIYYFRIAGEGGFGLHRTYTPDGAIDETVTVRDGDAFLIPRGYHGPCVAAPGRHMYYLNVLAGPAPERSMAFCDDPAHHWVRDSWAAQAIDPRLPLSAAEPGP